MGASPLQVTTVVKNNLDLCPGHDQPGSACDIDPLSASVSRATSASTSTAAIEAANQQWWAAFWNASYVELPGDARLERFYYAHSYLIGSASREGKVAAGLWGPWVHMDSPGWAGDYTLVPCPVPACLPAFLAALPCLPYLPCRSACPVCVAVRLCGSVSLNCLSCCPCLSLFVSLCVSFCLCQCSLCVCL